MRKKTGTFVIFGIFVVAAAMAMGLNWAFKNRTPSSSSVKKIQPEKKVKVSSPPPAKSASEVKKSLSLKGRYCENPHGTTCSTSWPSADPTGRVLSDAAGEVLALRQLRDLIRDHPSWTTGHIEEELAKKLYTPSRRKLIHKAFDWVVLHLSDYISQRPTSIFNDEEKRFLLERLEMIQLQTPPPVEIYADAPDLLTKNAVYYERTAEGVLRLRVGGAYLINATSWYNLVFTLAHEVAHSIDPCEAQNAGFSPRIYPSLVQCFVNMGWVEKEHSRCMKGEQVSEVFADWMATEMSAQALMEKGGDYTSNERAQAAVNFARDLCEQDSSPDYLKSYNHQMPQVRIGSVIGQSPSVRTAVGCARPVIRPNYCSLKENNKETQQ